MPLTQVECWEEDERPDPGSVGGITGGGVDGAVTMAGGENLMAARLKLPILPGELPPPLPRHRLLTSSGTRANRIPCGDCRATGPNKFGSLKVATVIHAVGPNYALIEGVV
jgi:O-acetyl-ADP-ribose deacetylase (regulator of RNase III)